MRHTCASSQQRDRANVVLIRCTTSMADGVCLAQKANKTPHTWEQLDVGFKTPTPSATGTPAKMAAPSAHPLSSLLLAKDVQDLI
jgi:hypothetical protein